MKTALEKLMRQGLSDQVFPGAVLLVARGGSIVFFEAYGRANIFSQRPVTRDTVFDLASLTKPLATTLAVAKLCEGGQLTLDRTLGVLLPEVEATPQEGITLRNLLEHCSGLPAYRPYYLVLGRIPSDQRQDALRMMLCKETLVNPVGERVLYSDVGFMFLTWVLERAAGRRLDELTRREIYEPLGLNDLFFVDLMGASKPTSFAATERCAWRGRVIEGAVHDENAYAAGGIAGHAGLFGKAADVYLLLQWMLDVYRCKIGVGPLRADTLHRFLGRNPLTGRPLGFDAPAKEGSSSGRFFSPKTVGHLGFTGTSFWMDLDRELIVLLLTNRVHPTRENERIKAFRPRLHDQVMKIFFPTECKLQASAG